MIGTHRLKLSAEVRHYVPPLPPHMGVVKMLILPCVEMECEGETFMARLLICQPENLTWVVQGDGTDWVEYEGEMVMERIG